jgi:hypothetical protein
LPEEPVSGCNPAALATESFPGCPPGPRGGFERGGWALPRNDEVMGRKRGEGMAGGGSLLPGGRTYEDFYGFWPNQSGNPFTEVLNRVPK